MGCQRPIFAMLLIISISLAAGCRKKAAAPVVPAGNENAGGSRAGNALQIAIADLKSKSLDKRTAALSNINQLDQAATIPALLEALSDKTFTDGAVVSNQANSTREAVVLALLKLGPEGEKAVVDVGLKALVAGLADPNVGVREHTIFAISLLGPRAKSASGPLLKLTTDANEFVRRAAYEALRKTGGIPAQEVAVNLLNPDPKIVYDAIVALNSVQPLPKELIPKLVDVVKRPQVEMEPAEAMLARMEAAEALASYGKDAEQAVPALMALLKSLTLADFEKYYRPRPDASTIRVDASPVMIALRKIGKPAVPALIEGLTNEGWLARYQSAQVISGIGPDAADALPAVREAFDKEFQRKDANFTVIISCGLAIVQLGGDPEPPIAKIAELLKNPDPKLRYETVFSLARFGRKGGSAVMSLIPLLDDPEVIIQQQTAETLRMMGPAAKAAIPALGKKLEVPMVDVRRGAAKVLKGLGPHAVETVPALAKLLADSDDSLRKEILETIIAIGPGAKAAVPELAKLANAKDDTARVLAIEALGIIGADAKSATNELVAALGQKDSETLVAAALALGQIGNATPEVVKALASKLKDIQMRTRIAAARALAMLGPAAKAAGPDLLVFGGSTTKDPNPTASVWAAVALYKLGFDSTGNLAFVLSALKNRGLDSRAKSGRLAAMDAADLLGADAKGVLTELIDSLNDRTPLSAYDKTPVRVRAIQAIGMMGPAAKDAVTKLGNLLKENDQVVRLAVLEALGRMGPAAEGAGARLRELVRTDPQLAEKAQEVLDRFAKK